MKIEDILLLGETDKIIATIQGANAIDFDPVALQAVYDGTHTILDRADKIITDSEGRATGTTPTAKLVLNYQKKIVENAVAFLLGAPVTILKKSEGGDEAFQYLLDSLDSMKFHSKCKELARKLFIQRQAAKLYFIKNPDDPNPLNKKLSSLILSSENGNYWANFNDTGDMDALLRTYEKKALIDGKEVTVPVYELYTATDIKKGEKLAGAWVETSTPNIYLKIPAVTYTQSFEEWADAQTLINTQELSLSELVDTNQYFASPIAKTWGNVTNMPDKNDSGKMINCELITDPQTGQVIKSDVDYLTWNQRPESLKMQFDLIEKFIFAFTQTADISFLTMIQSSLGNISGVALKLLLLDPISKAMVKQEQFDENIQRELSVIKAILGTMETKYASDYELMKFDIQFNSILPDNISEVINYLTAATAGEAIISKQTAIERNPLITNKAQELERLQAEQTEQGTEAIKNESFNL